MDAHFETTMVVKKICFLILDLSANSIDIKVLDFF